MYHLPSETELDIELGRDLGYDYAHYGLTIPENAPSAFMEGYKLSKFQNRTHRPKSRTHSTSHHNSIIIFIHDFNFQNFYSAINSTSALG
jgi:hypothetical protein